MIGNAKTTNTFKNTAVKMLQNPKLISAVSDAIKSTKPVVVTERQDVKPLEEMKATDCGVLSSNIAKTQDTEKYERIYKNLDKESKEKFDSLPSKEKVMIAEIFKNSSDDRIVENTAEKTKIQKQFLNNLIDIFQDDSYFKLKDCFTSNKVDMYFLKNYRIGDINDYLDKTKTTPRKR